MMMKYKAEDVKRASFQFEGYFALFRMTNEAGVIEYREEGFKGEVIHSVLNSKRTFEAYVASRINTILKEKVDV